MRRIFLGGLAAVLAALGLASCAAVPSQQKVTLVVAASDDFEPLLRQLAQAYHSRQTWVDIELHTANSARLEEDFKNGAAYDVYITSNPTSVGALYQKDALNPISIHVLSYNQLVLVAAPESDLRLDYHVMTTAAVRQIAVANPDSMLGHLTNQALTNMHYLPSHTAQPLASVANPTTTTPTATPLLPSLEDTMINLEPKLLVVNSDDDVIAAVKDGRAQVGLTYASYAFADKKIRILQALQDPSGKVPYQPIEYDMGIPRNAPHNDEAWNFLDYLRSAEAHAIMQRGGLL
ncbi:MAG TPA: extracellular solute-binding protein [Opitutales bacterium]|jgi:molybdate transport system substrate-binding protein|nr:extracellular solute-binding protein [Opitutales bacterium]